MIFTDTGGSFGQVAALRKDISHLQEILKNVTQISKMGGSTEKSSAEQEAPVGQKECEQRLGRYTSGEAILALLDQVIQQLL